MTFECSNTIYGTTGNPYDPTRIPGGSSGGEAALISGGGSILGMGGDIGGSLRIPAHMSGCCAIKPTGGRIRFVVFLAEAVCLRFMVFNATFNSISVIWWRLCLFT